MVRDTASRAPVESRVQNTKPNATTITMPIASDSRNAAFATDQGSSRVTYTRARRGFGRFLRMLGGVVCAVDAERARADDAAARLAQLASSHGKEAQEPRFHVFGHIHEGYGAELHEGTWHVNASICTVEQKV